MHFTIHFYLALAVMLISLVGLAITFFKKGTLWLIAFIAVFTVFIYTALYVGHTLTAKNAVVITCNSSKASETSH